MVVLCAVIKKKKSTSGTVTVGCSIIKLAQFAHISLINYFGNQFKSEVHANSFIKTALGLETTSMGGDLSWMVVNPV